MGLWSRRSVWAGVKFTQNEHTTQLLYNKLYYTLLLELTSWYAKANLYT